MLKDVARSRKSQVVTHFITTICFQEGHADHQDDTRMQEYMKNSEYKEKASTLPNH